MTFNHGCGHRFSKFREHVNTLLLQDILSEEMWQRRLTDADRRALSPLFWTHVNPYGRFELGMNSHLDLAVVA
ncbi:Tn3 family transposase [Streptomyces mirabilis]|uniref:Tn3 family transposase n=1 Tax=Streptomyces mirabilis TaxID=68239 RepID=UPI00365EF0DB